LLKTGQKEPARAGFIASHQRMQPLVRLDPENASWRALDRKLEGDLQAIGAAQRPRSSRTRQPPPVQTHMGGNPNRGSKS
jgi:hypothetical protein